MTAPLSTCRQLHWCLGISTAIKRVYIVHFGRWSGAVSELSLLFGANGKGRMNRSLLILVLVHVVVSIILFLLLKAEENYPQLLHSHSLFSQKKSQGP